MTLKGQKERILQQSMGGIDGNVISKLGSRVQSIRTIQASESFQSVINPLRKKAIAEAEAARKR